MSDRHKWWEQMKQYARDEAAWEAEFGDPRRRRPHSAEQDDSPRVADQGSCKCCRKIEALEKEICELRQKLECLKFVYRTECWW